MSVDLSKSSVLQWFEEIEKHRCGYCKNESSLSNGMWAESLTVDDYQNLIDRGWRRSGKYCYKPIMDKTCCPLYTIKCDSVNFSLSKSQRKVIKKFNKYLKEGELNSEVLSDLQNVKEEESCVIVPKDAPNINLNNVKYIDGTSEDEPTSKVEEKMYEKETEKDKACQSNPILKNPIKDGQEKGPDPSKPPCKKAKLLRIERKKEKSLKRGIHFEKTQAITTCKSLEEFLDTAKLEDNKIQLRMALIPTSIPNSRWEEVEGMEFELYKKYQMIIHQDPPSKLSLSGFSRFLVKSPLKICLERMSLENDCFHLCAELYKKYQMIIHNDPPNECDKDQFYKFLIETPLQPQMFPEGVEGPGYGSFHQQYYLNDKLIAVGVIDILPKCVSSVYFFYDPDYRNLTLGTYGSMRELGLTRQLQKSLPDLRSYYMGFYIHSCPKMRYKGKLVPSFLACPETYAWIPIERCLPLLEDAKYARLNDDIDAIDDNLPSQEDIMKIKIVYQYRLMNFRNYKEIVGDEENEKYQQIGNLVGKSSIKTLVFWER